MSLIDLKKKERFLKAVKAANSMRMLLALDSLGEPSTLDSINHQIHQIKEGLSSGQMRHTIERLEDLNMVSKTYEKRGKKIIAKYSLTSDGKKLVEAFKRFLQELEEE